MKIRVTFWEVILKLQVLHLLWNKCKNLKINTMFLYFKICTHQADVQDLQECAEEVGLSDGITEIDLNRFVEVSAYMKCYFLILCIAKLKEVGHKKELTTRSEKCFMACV